MDDTHIIIIRFSNEIHRQELPLFRGAVNAIMPRKNILFHNHVDDGFRNAYPLIQYKRIHRRAAIVALGDGIAAMHDLLATDDFHCRLGQRQELLTIEGIDHATISIVPLSEKRRYRLREWLPLNTDNYLRFQDAPSLVEQMQILEDVLTGNILSFLKEGAGLRLETPFTVHLTAITDRRVVHVKGVGMTQLDIEFTCDLALPEYIGLGKHASLGHGILTEVKKNENNRTGKKFINNSIQ